MAEKSLNFMLINLFAQPNRKEKQPKSNVWLTIHSSCSLSFYLPFTLTSDEAKHQIAFILEKISELRPAEKLLLYLKMPGGQSEVGELSCRYLLSTKNGFSNRCR
jgi:hypothetical protein